MFIICDKIQDDFELFAVKEFHEAIEKHCDDVYFCNMIKLPPTKTNHNYHLVSLISDQMY